MPATIRVSVDSDFAADRATRRSTLVMVQRLGRHPIKTTSTFQTSVGLNVSDCELYALVHGAAHLGIDLLLIVESDSSSAKAFASRRRLGKQRHVQTRYLWIQDTVAASKQFHDQEGTNNREHQ